MTFYGRYFRDPRNRHTKILLPTRKGGTIVFRHLLLRSKINVLYYKISACVKIYWMVYRNMIQMPWSGKNFQGEFFTCPLCASQFIFNAHSPNLEFFSIIEEARKKVDIVLNNNSLMNYHLLYVLQLSPEYPGWQEQSCLLPSHPVTYGPLHRVLQKSWTPPGEYNYRGVSYMEIIMLIGWQSTSKSNYP